VSDEYLTKKSAGIVAFAIAIESLEGKWKISQNRSAEDRERVIAWLDKGDSSSCELAAMMRQVRDEERKKGT
jgi:transcriptional regulator